MTVARIVERERPRKGFLSFLGDPIRKFLMTWLAQQVEWVSVVTG